MVDEWKVSIRQHLNEDLHDKEPALQNREKNNPGRGSTNGKDLGEICPWEREKSTWLEAHFPREI